VTERLRREDAHGGPVRGTGRVLADSEVGLFESYGIVVDHLNHVGPCARRPFE